jgi:Zn finger protein HypA/HybF involved in hydrogenase expression
MAATIRGRPTAAPVDRPRAAREDFAVKCPYCKNQMIEIVLGWQCPACHATLGRERALSR